MLVLVGPAGRWWLHRSSFAQMVVASMQTQSNKLPPRSPSSASSRPLGYEHISARGRLGNATATILPGGLHLKKHMMGAIERKGGGKRSEVKGFSRQSKRRLDLLLAGIQWNSRPCHFVTLTYHFNPGDPAQGLSSPVCASVPTAVPPTSWGDLDDLDPDVPASPTWRIWKNDLRAFEARLRRAYGDRVQGGLWKQEFQKRGVVHFHLTIFWREGKEPSSHELTAWVALAWNEIAEPGDGAHFRHGSWVQVVYNVGGGQMRALMFYLSKYMAKSYELEQPTGRIWGQWGQLPTQVIAEVFLPWRDVVWLCRRLRRWGRSSTYVRSLNGSWMGFLVMYDGLLVADLLRDLHEDPPD